MRCLAPILLLFGLPLAPRAETVMGRVVDAFGQGVPGVDIDVDNLGSGGDPDIFNDGTDANGFFVMTVLQPGVYDIIFNPPPPPASTELSLTLPDVLTVGVVDLGTIVLPPGVALSGTVTDSSGIPVANVNLDVIDEGTGSRLVTPNDRTDLFGNFSIAVPAAPIEVRFDATTVPFPTLASQAFEMSPTADTNMGTIVLPPGWIVSGTVQTTLGQPVANADFDFTDNATLGTIYTPKDNTDAQGNFAVVVPAGTYDIAVCPPVGGLIVGLEIDGFPIATDVNVGILQLQPGVVLSGTVRKANGSPAAGVDVNVDDAFTGSTVALCRDNTDASGFYSVVVPTGTFRVTFTAPCRGDLDRVDVHPTVVVNASTQLDGTLPPGPCQATRRRPPGGFRSGPPH